MPKRVVKSGLDYFLYSVCQGGRFKEVRKDLFLSVLAISVQPLQDEIEIEKRLNVPVGIDGDDTFSTKRRAALQGRDNRLRPGWR